MLFVLLAIAFQSPAPPVDAAAYLSFFGDAIVHADATTGTYPSILNGQVVGESTQLSIADALGITAEQARSLVQIGSLCKSDVAAFDVRVRALVFESRIRGVKEEPTEVIEAQLKALEAKRAELILSYVQKLQTLLGPDAFRRTEDYVRTHAGGGSFFYLVPQPKKKL